STRVRSLVRDVDLLKIIKHGFALYFELARQIVNANLAHLLLLFPRDSPAVLRVLKMQAFIGSMPKELCRPCILARQTASARCGPASARRCTSIVAHSPINIYGDFTPWRVARR